MHVAVFSCPSNFMDAQQAARAFHERGALAEFVIAKLTEGLRRAGYAAEFGAEVVVSQGSACPGSFASAS
jgi:hypothetical protein